MNIVYKLILTGDGEDPVLSDLELDFSSLNYSMNGNASVSIGATVKNDTGVAARSNGDLEFYVDDVLFASAELTEIIVKNTPNRSYVELNALSEDQSFTQDSGNIELDSKLSEYTLKDGESVFVTPYSNQYYVPGATVEYDSVEYDISDVSFSISEKSAPSWTLKEGTIASTASTGGGSCNYTLVDGVPQTKTLGGGATCSVVPGTAYGSLTPAMYFDGYYVRTAFHYIYINYFQFELSVVSDVDISISGAFTDLYINDPIYEDQLGFEMVLSYGGFSFPAKINDYKISSSGTNTTLSAASLPVGLYTVRPLNIADRADLAISYTIELTVTAV